MKIRKDQRFKNFSDDRLNNGFTVLCVFSLRFHSLEKIITVISNADSLLNFCCMYVEDFLSEYDQLNNFKLDWHQIKLKIK